MEFATERDLCRLSHLALGEREEFTKGADPLPMDGAIGWEFSNDGVIELSEYARRDEEWLGSHRCGARAGLVARECLSVGVSQKDNLPSLDRARRAGIPLVRRSTGGSGVLLSPQDLLWSLILPRSHLLATPPVTAAYGRLGGAVTRFLAGLGIAAEWGEPLDLSAEFCPFGARGSPLLARGRVIGGAAQHLTATLLLHHGFLYYRHDPVRPSQLFDVSRQTLADRVTFLERAGARGNAESLSSALLDSFRAWLQPGGETKPSS